MMKNEHDDDRTALIFLGTGCSGAVPDFRCLLQPSDPPCHVCSQSLSLLPHLNPNYRCNTSLLIDYCCKEEDGRHYYIIIDVGKSFREQVLRWFTFYKIPKIDSIILTHDHADAVHGLDEIRSIQPRGSAIDINPLPVFLSQFTMESISTRFPYLVEKKVKEVPRRVSQLDWRIIEENCDKPFIASGLSFTPLPVMHGEDYIALGFLFGEKSKVAYISDVSRIPPSTEYVISKAGAGQLDLLILDTNIPFKIGILRLRPYCPRAVTAGAERTLNRTGRRNQLLVLVAEGEIQDRRDSILLKLKIRRHLRRARNRNHLLIFSDQLLIFFRSSSAHLSLHRARSSSEITVTQISTQPLIPKSIHPEITLLREVFVVVEQFVGFFVKLNNIIVGSIFEFLKTGKRPSRAEIFVSSRQKARIAIVEGHST